MSGRPFDYASATEEERRAYAERVTRAERKAQGLPSKIDDPVVAERIASIFRSSRHSRSQVA